MSKLKFLLIGIVPFLVASCTVLNEPATQVLQSGLSATDTGTVQENNTVTKSKGNLKAWEFRVTNVKYEGQLVKEEYMTYEAAEAWTMVSVTVKNTTGKRQRQDEVGAYLLFAKLIDSKGDKYELPQLKFNSNPDLLNKPFAAGETRSFDLLFDAPKNIKADQLIIDALEIEGGSIRLKL